MLQPLDVLKKYFGYSAFRSPQDQVIAAVLQQHDAFAILPTGGGKSICYQIPGIIFPGITIVVSPLVALMKDQVDALQQKGIAATFINSSLAPTEKAQRLLNFQRGEYKFVYVSPEKLLTPEFLATATKLSISFVAIDEAHCISQWGHDFRPEYQQISKFVEQLSTRPVILAVTATATPLVQKEILESLHLRSPHCFLSSFERTNLHITIRKCRNQTVKLLKLLLILKKHQNQRGIIYCPTRSKTEEMSVILKNFHYACNFYHGGMTSEDRQAVQHAYSSGESLLIAATNAFGMGVDIPDVRFVIHLHVPQNVEGYYQEIGRGGRDGKPAECYLLYTAADLILQQELFGDKTPHLLKHSRRYLQHNICRHKFLLAYFGEKKEENCHRCDICIPSSIPTELSVEQKNFQELRSHHSQQLLSHSAAQFIAATHPKTLADFLAIPGIGRGWVEQYATLFTERATTP